MQAATTQALGITIDGANKVSALLDMPADARAGYVFAHGAGG